jgi:hypothetical protein
MSYSTAFSSFKTAAVMPGTSGGASVRVGSDALAAAEAGAEDSNSVDEQTVTTTSGDKFGYQQKR